VLLSVSNGYDDDDNDDDNNNNNFEKYFMAEIKLR
jgi:hypothetical protein